MDRNHGSSDDSYRSMSTQELNEVLSGVIYPSTTQTATDRHGESSETTYQHDTAVTSFSPVNTLPMVDDVEEIDNLMAALVVVLESVIKEVTIGTNDKIRFEFHDIRIIRTRDDTTLVSKPLNLTIESKSTDRENEESDEREESEQGLTETASLYRYVKPTSTLNSFPTYYNTQSAWPNLPYQATIDSKANIFDTKLFQSGESSSCVSQSTRETAAIPVFMRPSTFTQTAEPLPSPPTQYDARPCLPPERNPTQSSVYDTPAGNEDVCQLSLSATGGTCNCGACILTNLQLLSSLIEKTELN